MSDSILFTCPDCQAEFEMNAIPENEEIYAACPNCGSINLYTVNEPDGSENQPTPAQTEEKPKKKHPIWRFLLIVFAALMLITAIHSLTEKDTVEVNGHVYTEGEPGYKEAKEMIDAVNAAMNDWP